MAERTLNARQVEVLKWIGAGCPDGVMHGFTHKSTAVALKSRRLVQISKARGSWSALLTEAGAYFVQHGSYPQGHWPTHGQANAPRPALPTKARPEPRVTAVRPVEQLIADVVAAGGELAITGNEAPRYKSLVSSATRFGKVPEGKLLKVESGGSWNKQFVRLSDKPQWMTTVLEPIPVAGTLRKPHPAIQELRDDRIAFRAPVQSRVYRLLDSLAKEAQRRGYRVEVPDWSGGGSRSNGLLTFGVKGREVGVTIDELNDRVPHLATATELRDAERYSWNSIPTHDLVPSGRLRIRVLKGWAVRQESFADTKTIDLADRLSEVLQEIELRAHDAELRRIERERQETERRAQRERDVQAAKVAARDDLLGKVLLDQVARWHEVQRLDGYLTAAEAQLGSMGVEAKFEAEAWIEWARDYRRRIDPLNGRLALPDEQDFTASELAPFMPQGWSPYSP